MSTFFCRKICIFKQKAVILRSKRRIHKYRYKVWWSQDVQDVVTNNRHNNHTGRTAKPGRMTAGKKTGHRFLYYRTL